MTDARNKGSDLKVLLLAPNWLGDAVMFSALIEFLHQHRQLRDGRRLLLDLAVRPAWAPLFEDDCRLNDLILVQRGGRHSGLFGGWNLGQDFRKLNPDAVLLGPPSLRAGLGAWRSGAALRIGFSGDGRRPLLTHTLPTTTRGTFHHSAELVQLGNLLLKTLGEQESKIQQAEILPKVNGCDSIPAAVLDSATPVWVLAPGATYGSAKSWPLVRSMEFVKIAMEDHGKRVVLLGDAAASKFAEGLARGLDLHLEQNLSGGHGLVDLTGQTDLRQVVSILKSSQAFVGNDSGLMHLSASLGVPTVGVFGSSNPHWTSPKGERTAVVNAEGFECRPCYRKSCNQKEFCLDAVSAQSVWEKLDHLLSQ